MILEKRINWKAVLLTIAAMLFLYTLCRTLDNKTLAAIFYYIGLPGITILSIYKLLPKR